MRVSRFFQRCAGIAAATVLATPVMASTDEAPSEVSGRSSRPISTPQGMTPYEVFAVAERCASAKAIKATYEPSGRAGFYRVAMQRGTERFDLYLDAHSGAVRSPDTQSTDQQEPIPAFKKELL